MKNVARHIASGQLSKFEYTVIELAKAKTARNGSLSSFDLKSCIADANELWDLLDEINEHKFDGHPFLNGKQLQESR